MTHRINGAHIAALIGLAASMPLVAQEGASSPVDAELIPRFLERSLVEGSRLVCDPVALSEALQVNVEQPERPSFNARSSIFSWEGQVSPKAGQGAITRGGLTRFKSSATSFCAVHLELRSGAFCDYRSSRRLRQGKMPDWVPWIAPHGPTGVDRGFLLFQGPGSDQDGELWVSARSGERCAQSVTVRIKARWLTDEMAREVTGRSE